MTAGFFGRIFGKKSESAEIDMQVYIRRAFVNELIVRETGTGQIAVISFFESTHRQLKEMAGVNQEENYFLYSSLFNSASLSKLQACTESGKRIVISERYPVASKETELLTHLKSRGIATQVLSYCALDDLIMQAFGSENIISLMKRMGMSETECIQHEMINSSLVRAQNKIAAKVTYEQQAKSPEDWFNLNAPLAK